MERLGLKNGIRNPASIANAQHHDASNGQKKISASPSQIKKVISPSTTATVVDEDSLIRAYNNNAAVAFLWVGQEDQVPGTVDATNGVPVAPNSAENFLVGFSADEQKSLMVKTSAATLLVLQFKSTQDG